ncbi:MAG: DUF177 domain-containing protein [Pseudomonadota bacterium]
MTLKPQKTVELATLDENKAHEFVLKWDAEDRAVFSKQLDLRQLRKFDAKVTLQKINARDWRAKGTIGATAIQACVATTQDVTTRIDAAFERHYMADFDVYDAETRSETHLEENLEPLGTDLDLETLALEVLALHLPDYPRASDTETIRAVSTPKGATPIEETAKPFASLAQLKDKLENKK